LFGDFELHRITIRDIRDEMFAHLNPWDQIMEDWARLSGDISDPYTVTPPAARPVQVSGTTLHAR
jgi:hypothetical protein